MLVLEALVDPSALACRLVLFLQEDQVGRPFLEPLVLQELLVRH